MPVDNYFLEKEIRKGQETFPGIARRLAEEVSLGERNYYTAAVACAQIVDSCWRQRLFISPRRAAVVLRRVLVELDNYLSCRTDLPATAEQVPQHLIEPRYYTLNEATSLLGEAYYPPQGELAGFPIGRAFVVTLAMAAPGNLLLGLHWGGAFEAHMIVDKEQFRGFAARSSSA